MPGRKPFWDKPSKYLLFRMYEVMRLDTMEKKIFPSQLVRAIGRKFAGSSADPDLWSRMITACCQDDGTILFSKLCKKRWVGTFAVTDTFSRRCTGCHLGLVQSYCAFVSGQMLVQKDGGFVWRQMLGRHKLVNHRWTQKQSCGHHQSNSLQSVSRRHLHKKLVWFRFLA